FQNLIAFPPPLLTSHDAPNPTHSQQTPTIEPLQQATIMSLTPHRNTRHSKTHRTLIKIKNVEAPTGRPFVETRQRSLSKTVNIPIEEHRDSIEVPIGCQNLCQNQLNSHLVEVRT
ncbi:hypothetical protein PanWU01x14_198520, partial [Parasponia andersonii]